MSQLVGMTVHEYADTRPGQALSVLELGGGTGITTLAILAASDSLNIVSVDSEPAMQSQAKHSLKQWADEGRILFECRHIHVQSCPPVDSSWLPEDKLT
jgi:predicted O-methyltransferase YrrM